MTPYQMLFVLAGAGSKRDRERAGGECLAYLRRRTSRAVRTRTGTRLAIDAGYREEVVSKVTLSLLTKADHIVHNVVLAYDKFRRAGLGDPAVMLGQVEPPSVVVDGSDTAALWAEADALVAAYVERMLAHCWLDMLDKIGQLEALPISGPSEPAGAVVPTVHVQVAVDFLKRATDHHLAGVKRADLREQRQESWTQLIGLSLGDITMDEILDATIRGDPALQRAAAQDLEVARKRARDRVLQRHRRMREYVLEAIAHLEQIGNENGGFGHDDALLARNLVQGLLVRCQRKDSDESS